jgi:predicted RNA methylase
MIDTHIQCLRPLIPLRAATIIDMGCGAGSVVRRLAELGAKAIGIEADPNRLALARRQRVVEALAEGPYFQVMRLIEDQSESRKATLRTLADIPALGLRPVMSVRYDHTEAFSDYADFRQRMIAGVAARAQAFATRDAIIRAAFDQWAETDGGRRVLVQPVRMFHFVKPEVLQ